MHQRQAAGAASSTDRTSGGRPFSWFHGVRRGLAQRCPACGETHLYRRYLKVNDVCLRCGLAVGDIRSDDAPPYFTILLVGHIIVPSMLILEELCHPPQWVHFALWVPLALLLTLTLLPRVKGAVIALHWANKIKG
ncbi:MAG TPA: DUF983 domain-containing protein [Alphaproteobacteria bacterium]|nr:DUF983 domain-containing protein [Alphaproteobacteria bacterium]